MRVLYFASARTAIGRSTETILLPSTPLALPAFIALVQSAHPTAEVESVLRTCRWSVDNTLIEIDELHEWTLKGGEEVAAIPPVSGG